MKGATVASPDALCRGAGGDDECRADTEQMRA
jgi:hypothetical protein